MNPPALDLSALRTTIESLDGALGIVDDQAWFQAQSTTMQNTLVAGVIQNFEFVYELSARMLRRELERQRTRRAQSTPPAFATCCGSAQRRD